ncbi:Nucleoside diphosphate kinase 7-like [Homarus americanus]|uniref:Nucleoside diphosphate kinase 7-like n=1 Tax=Homarus americanus TaxID=6706 RepID=A0A8J5JP07_HOMAM|nr:Nucleoside diphosphate kinase 7-like [Homarus americanus]
MVSQQTEQYIPYHLDTSSYLNYIMRQFNSFSTFTMVKPDTVHRLGDVVEMIEAGGLKINRMKMAYVLDYVTSGPVVGMELRGQDAVARWRKMLGSVKDETASEDSPKTIREKFGTNRLCNAEMNLFFSSSNVSDNTIQASSGMNFVLIPYNDTSGELCCMSRNDTSVQSSSTTSNTYSTVLSNTTTSNTYSTVLSNTTTSNTYSTVLSNTTTSNTYSAVLSNTTTSNTYSTVLSNTTTSNTYSAVLSNTPPPTPVLSNTTTSNTYSAVSNTTTSNTYSTVLSNTTTSNTYSTVLSNTTTSNTYSAVLSNTTTSNTYSAVLSNTTTSNTYTLYTVLSNTTTSNTYSAVLSNTTTSNTYTLYHCKLGRTLASLQTAGFSISFLEMFNFTEAQADEFLNKGTCSETGVIRELGEKGQGDSKKIMFSPELAGQATPHVRRTMKQ